MNNTFNFKRFSSVVANDWHALLRNYGITILIFCCLPVLFWLASLVFKGGEITQDTRWSLVGFATALAVMNAAEKIYGDVNLPRKGISFAMLPASSLEKFFSMLFYCAIVVPVVAMIGLWCVDAILALLPVSIYNGVLYIRFADTPDIGTLIVFFIVCSWLVSALFMFGNMLFKRRKTAKTFACSLLVAFVVVMLLQIIDAWEGIWNLYGNIPDSFVPWLLIIEVFVFACVFFYLTYRKIKTQKY